MTKTSALAPLLALSIAAAQEPPPSPPSPEFFHGRRAQLLELVRREAKAGEHHLVVLRGAPERADMDTFYQDQDFYYLSGVSEPGVAMILDPVASIDELLVPPFNRFTAQWEGARLAPGEQAAAAAGFATAGNVRRLQARLEELVGDGGDVVVWTLLEPQANRTSTPGAAGRAAQQQQRDAFDGRPSREEAFRDKLQLICGGAEIRDLTGLVHRLRAIKTAVEIAQIRAAAKIAAHGIAEAMKSAQPGIHEFQIAAAARYVFSRLGAGPDAYAAIVGAGRNGCVLHYSANAKRAADGELVVMDYAPTVNGYCADVTRTFPVNGAFTQEQRQLVTDVYEVQQALIGRVRPGAKLSELGMECARMLRQRGYDSLHGPCHHVGLAVHDVGGDVLEPGMIITVEPGAYLVDEGMGCRIEDTVLVTGDGCENLSAAVPATPDAIEQLMREQGVADRPVGLHEK